MIVISVIIALSGYVAFYLASQFAEWAGKTAARMEPDGVMFGAHFCVSLVATIVVVIGILFGWLVLCDMLLRLPLCP